LFEKKKKKIVKIFNIATKAKERKRRICPLNFVLPSSTSLATMNPTHQSTSEG
jgi:hypothetical protein